MGTTFRRRSWEWLIRGRIASGGGRRRKAVTSKSRDSPILHAGTYRDSGIHRVVRSRFLAGHTPAQAGGGGHDRKCRRPVRGPSRSLSTVVIGRSSKLGGSRCHPKIPRLHHCSVSAPHGPLPLLAVLRSADPEPRAAKRGAQQGLPYDGGGPVPALLPLSGSRSGPSEVFQGLPEPVLVGALVALENRVGRLPAASSQSTLSDGVDAPSRRHRDVPRWY